MNLFRVEQSFNYLANLNELGGDMAMEVVKSSADYKVYKKRSGRYAVKDARGKLINGEKKGEILLKEGLIKNSPKSKKEKST